MPAKKYKVMLTQEQREQVESIARSYKHSEAQRKRARILLLADIRPDEKATSDEAIAQQVKVSAPTVENVRRRFACDGLAAALYRKEQKHRKARLLDGEAEAFLIATVCSAPPQGRKQWSLHLLADKLVVAGYVDCVSHETVRQTLKKMNLNLG